MPPDTGSYRIVFPKDFDIAPAATPKCTIVHTNVPFQNWPDRSADYYNHIVVPNCVWDNGVLSLYFPGTLLRQFYGVKTGICTYLVLTTYPSLVNNAEGYRSPLNSGCYQFQFYAMDGANVLESSIPNICIRGNQLSSLTIFPSNIDTNTNAIYMFKFTTTAFIPNSYFYLSGTYPGPKSAIEISFETYESYQIDLAGQYDAFLQVFCQQIQGIVPPNGEYLSCKYDSGSTTAVPVFTHYPAKITITNFKEISLGTAVEFHLPLIRNPNTDGWIPQVTIGIYQSDYMGLKTWIQDQELVNLLAVTASTALGVQYVCISPTTLCSVTNNKIGKRTTLNLYFRAQSITLVGGSMIVLKFPSQYEDIPTSGVTAYIQRNPVTSTMTDTFIISGIIVYTYKLAKMVALIIPIGSSIIVNQDCIISLINFVNPSYIDSCSSCPITYYSISPTQKVIDQYETDSIYNIFGFKAATFSIDPISLSSTFANSAEVVQTYIFGPNFDLASGTKTSIVIPTNFPDILTLNPLPSCYLNITATCTVKTRSVEISGYEEIPFGTKIKLEISGTLNPSTAVYIGQGSTGFYIESVDSSGRQIAYSELPSLRISGPKSVTRIQSAITTTFPNANVQSTYKFTMNAMQDLPKGSKISITFPTEYSTLPSNERCFVGGVLDSYMSCNTFGRVLTVEINEDIDRFRTFDITLPGVMNPSITTPDDNQGQYTSAFSIQTYYAGQLIDELDPNDTGSKLYIKPAPANTMVIVETDLMPKTEGEMALYTFVIENPIFLANTDDVSVIFMFPSDYPYQMLNVDIDLFCYSAPEHVSCSLNFPRMVEFRTLSPYTLALNMLFRIFGVSNPIESTTNKFGIYMYDNKEKTLIASNNEVTFTITAIPAILDMISVEATSLITHTDADYTFNFTINDIGVLRLGGLYLDWPGNYYKLFYDPNYYCEYTSPDDEILKSPTCVYMVSTGYRRTLISIPNDISEDYGDVSLKFMNVTTLQQEGLSGSFIMRIFDSENNVITARSYPNLTPYSNLYFYNLGYRIYVNTTIIYVYRGSYSYPIELSLEKASQTGITVTPTIIEGDLGCEPSVLEFQYEWAKTLSFRVFAPISANTTTYTLHFNKYENGKSEDERDYKPMIDIDVVVLDPRQETGVYSEEISKIPLSGTSLPVKV